MFVPSDDIDHATQYAMQRSAIHGVSNLMRASMEEQAFLASQNGYGAWHDSTYGAQQQSFFNPQAYAASQNQSTVGQRYANDSRPQSFAQSDSSVASRSQPSSQLAYRDASQNQSTVGQRYANDSRPQSFAQPDSSAASRTQPSSQLAYRDASQNQSTVGQRYANDSRPQSFAQPDSSAASRTQPSSQPASRGASPNFPRAEGDTPQNGAGHGVSSSKNDAAKGAESASQKISAEQRNAAASEKNKLDQQKKGELPSIQGSKGADAVASPDTAKRALNNELAKDKPNTATGSSVPTVQAAQAQKDQRNGKRSSAANEAAGTRSHRGPHRVQSISAYHIQERRNDPDYNLVSLYAGVGTTKDLRRIPSIERLHGKLPASATRGPSGAPAEEPKSKPTANAAKHQVRSANGSSGQNGATDRATNAAASRDKVGSKAPVQAPLSETNRGRSRSSSSPRTRGTSSPVAKSPSTAPKSTV